MKVTFEGNLHEGAELRLRGPNVSVDVFGTDLWSGETYDRNTGRDRDEVECGGGRCREATCESSECGLSHEDSPPDHSSAYWEFVEECHECDLPHPITHVIRVGADGRLHGDIGGEA